MVKSRRDGEVFVDRTYSGSDESLVTGMLSSDFVVRTSSKRVMVSSFPSWGNSTQYQVWSHLLVVGGPRCRRLSWSVLFDYVGRGNEVLGFDQGTLPGTCPYWYDLSQTSGSMGVYRSSVYGFSTTVGIRKLNQ